MNPQRIPMRAYLAVVSIPSAATDDLWPPTMMPLATGTICVARRPAHIARHALSFMLTAIAVHSGTGNAVAKPPERH
jgi:hypothetical protein